MQTFGRFVEAEQQRVAELNEARAKVTKVKEALEHAEEKVARIEQQKTERAVTHFSKNNFSLHEMLN